MKRCDILEGFRPGSLDIEVKDTLPSTYIIPDLENTDPYKQYRYVVALASANAVKNKEVSMDQESAWNENTAVICYTPQEEIMNKANKLLGLKKKLISTKTSKEPPFVNTLSTVRTFKDYD